MTQRMQAIHRGVVCRLDPRHTEPLQDDPAGAIFMPRVGQGKVKTVDNSEPLSQVPTVLQFYHSHGPYDAADLKRGDYKFGQLTLIRGPESHAFVKWLKEQGVVVEVPEFIAKGI